MTSYLPEVLRRAATCELCGADIEVEELYPAIYTTAHKCMKAKNFVPATIEQKHVRAVISHYVALK